jgi:hypothetical protein
MRSLTVGTEAQDGTTNAKLQRRHRIAARHTAVCEYVQTCYEGKESIRDEIACQSHQPSHPQAWVGNDC